MIVIVCGGRYFTDYETLTAVLERFDITKIIQGGANGADRLGKRYANSNEIEMHEEKALWDNLDNNVEKVIEGVNKWGEEYNTQAGFNRNIRMAEMKPDLVIGFKGGRGTAHMLRIASDHNIESYYVKSLDEIHWNSGDKKRGVGLGTTLIRDLNDIPRASV